MKECSLNERVNIEGGVLGDIKNQRGLSYMLLINIYCFKHLILYEFSVVITKSLFWNAYFYKNV